MRQVKEVLNETGIIGNLGHSTVLVKLGGLSILTDPFLRESLVGIKRVAPLFVRADELDVDLVLISHAHLDHLDLKTLKSLRGDFVVICPEMTSMILRGFETVELRDFESTFVKGVKITKVPAKHKRGRSPLFPFTGVGGFVFEFDGLRLYFAGDTAFSNLLYSEISSRFKGIDVAILPIGGFYPYKLLRWAHQCPEEAYRAFEILKAGVLFPIHFGTWHICPSCVSRERAVQRLKAVYKAPFPLPGEALVLSEIF